MLSISLGPLVLSISQVIIFSGVLFFWGLTYLQTRKNSQQKEILDNVFSAIVVGFFVARIAFIITMWESYQQNWWQLLNISDGGFIISYGFAAGVLVMIRYAIGKKVVIKAYSLSILITFITLIIPTFAAVMYQTGIGLPKSMVLNMEGHEVDLSVYKGKPVVINFWATWCPPCRREMPVLAAAQENNPEIEFIFINQGESLTNVKTFINSEQLNLQNMFLDDSSNVSRESGAAGLPTTLFYNAEGKLVSSHMGELSHASLDYYLKKIDTHRIRKNL